MVKKYLRYLVYEAVVISTYLIASIYKIKNIQKKKILIYTDSRGFEITKLLNRRNPFSSYIGYFIRNYNVDYYISPRKHTTTLDFLELYYSKQRKGKKYDFVILHTGIVDFSPRPLSMLRLVYKKKRKLYNEYFDENLTEKHLGTHYKEKYENEFTNSIYSIEMMKQGILPQLKKIKNLIWISCNRVLGDWDGNYPKKRPVNMNVVSNYNSVFLNVLERNIDLSEWTDSQIKKYTCDNIHFKKAGMKHLEAEIIEEIKCDL